MGGGVFNEAYTLNKICEVAQFTKVGPILAQIVFDKSADSDNLNTNDIITVTDHGLRNILDNKITIYKKFSQYQPYSIACKNKAELDEAIKSVKTDKVVIKNPLGFGGRSGSFRRFYAQCPNRSADGFD